MAHIRTFSIKLVLILLMFIDAIKQGWCFNFSYPRFPPEVNGDFKLTGHSSLVQNAIQVTSDVSDPKLFYNLSGRIVYKDPIKLWRKGRVASFNSTFVLNVKNTTDPNNRPAPIGDGLAFILTEKGEIPGNSMDQWLGIVNASTNGSPQNNIVAIEFDTKKSFPGDLDNNHIGVNINSINSMYNASLNKEGLIIANGKLYNLTAMILYNGVSKTMNISVYKGNTVGEEPPVLKVEDFDLSLYLPKKVYVGFSASTGPISIERNCIGEWYFSIEDIGEASPRWTWVIISVGVVVSLIGVGGFGYWCYKRKAEASDDYSLPIFSGVGPKKFKLKDLKAATKNFNQKNELGRGGFGVVYKGNLEGQTVAVKRVRDTPKGMQNLIAEVTTIGSLHHKNLVELIGWCYEGSELLLVYEYMQNRSLDTLLYCNDHDGNLGKKTQDTQLSWDKRYNIIRGVAHALDYLHNECLRRVLHRDIKASNIMLDSEFNARLGDFGLARMFKLSEKTHYSTKEIAGTPGYMAPELFLTGKATTETDVFAFGVLALVLASGRKTGVQNKHTDDNNSNYSIIDWVWELYSSELVTTAIDPKLEGSYDERQAKIMLTLGLACCHPNPNRRPSMGYVLQVLTGEAAAPQVPPEKPAFVWPAPSPSFSHEDSFSGGMLSTLTSLSGR